jgi:3-hydroxybutyryl-CoA dehydrogenase
MLCELQAGVANPAQLILAHPFKPPHLIPLVELMVN